MTTRREAFLMSREKCPACGAARRALAGPIGKAKFNCGAVFSIINGEIEAVRSCPARCQRAARHWNQQTKGE